LRFRDFDVVTSDLASIVVSISGPVSTPLHTYTCTRTFEQPQRHRCKCATLDDQPLLQKMLRYTHRSTFVRLTQAPHNSQPYCSTKTKLKHTPGRSLLPMSRNLARNRSDAQYLFFFFLTPISVSSSHDDVQTSR
jgi:hypothetical protein